MASTHSPGRGVASRTNSQKAALAVGAVFLLVGVLGFIPGVTTDFGELSFAGPESHAHLLGIFQVSILHNIVHLLFGVAGVTMAKTAAGAYNFLLWGGIIYAVLFVYGLVVPEESSANFVPLNLADDLLHLVLALGMIGLAFALKDKHRTARGR
ncbi:protein of unknown function [Arthrobacter subterraneus]|uniref:DUF4383 domain-containing protein n=1 Tax=Arthrobacter subterraneus TaxID=335973 RepID=A0A1G8IRD8_9MICC|nr:DUF4383 domain-containing protein [Arthrobacter subterraneus]SDI21317.1 protein of unknown function [Arthrobacter subterraneus]